MKALKIVIIILVILLAIVLIPPLFMPSGIYLEKSLVLKAQPEVIWDQVNCLKNWENWDVWHQDSTMSSRYEGPECGVGSKNVWTYNKSTEGGSQTIIDSKEFEYIKTRLDFQGMGGADTEFKFEKADDGTKVTWTFKADKSGLLMRWLNAFMIKPEVAKSYEKGLNNLNELTMNMKSEPKWSTGDISEVNVDKMMAIAVKVESGPEEISKNMEDNFTKLSTYLQKEGASMAGPPFAIWYKYDDPENFVYDIAMPVSKQLTGEGDIHFLYTYEGKTVKADHFGDYSTTGHSWSAIMQYMKDKGLEPNGDPWEVYMTDPKDQPDPEKWLTVLYFPVK